MPTFYSGTKKAHYYKPDQYPLWPSIELINNELERFCEQKEHMVYFDAASLFLGSVGNEHYRAKGMKIITDLMPDNAHLNDDGHKLLTNVIAKEVTRIIYEDDESNHKTDSSGKITM